MTPQELATEFPLTPDSLPQAGVPQGRLEKFVHAESRIFPGTVRDCWIYVPAQYRAESAACVMIVQDGGEHLKHERRWHIPTVLDNLIHRGEVPVTVGVFINPGTVPAAVTEGAGRNNRSFEYDSLGDRYARFLLEEILPFVARKYSLRTDGNSRCIMGGSSGAFCAFNAAWERPEEFSRIVSIVGSYTALRGGHQAPPRVRLTEPKPLRVFLQSGARDLRVFAGDWWTANQEMLSALEYAGYEVTHVWAEHAGHDEFHGSTIFPDALRWVWQGYPCRIAAGVNSQQPLARFLVSGTSWKEVPGAYVSAGALATDGIGRVIFISPVDGGVYRIDETGQSMRLAQTPVGAGAIGWASNDVLYVTVPGAGQLIVIDGAGAIRLALEGLEVRGLSVARKRDVYFTVRGSRAIHRLREDGQVDEYPTGMSEPSGVVVATDQSQLIVCDADEQVGYVFSMSLEGGLSHGAPYNSLVKEPRPGRCELSQLAASVQGWWIAGSRQHLQLMDRNGLCAGLIATPQRQRPTGVAVGGMDGDMLYVSAGNRVYRRPIHPGESLWS